MSMTRAARVGFVAVLMLVPALAGIGPAGLAAESDNWPHFRGPTMNAAVADNPDLPETWSQTENVEWVTDVPGLGWSSPVVWGNRVFLTTVTAMGEFEQPKPGLYAPQGRPEPPPLEHDWLVYCLDLETGDVLWRRSVNSGRPSFARHMKNTYASETPTTDGERVYVRFGELGLYTFDMDGNQVWSLEIPDRQTRSDWGSASSPVLHDDKLIIVYDNEEESWIAALDKRTGREIWRTARDEVSSWATPYIWEHEQRTEIVTSGMNQIRSYDLDGNLLWELTGMSSIAIPTPFSEFGLVYVASRYIGDQFRPVYAIQPGAAGDISVYREVASGLQEGFPGTRNYSQDDHVVWSYPLLGTYNTTALVYGDIYYTLLDRGFLTAHDAATGEAIYGRQRLEIGNGFTASPWGYNGKIFLLSEDGDTFVVKAGPEFEILHKNSLSEMSLATPAVARGSLILRTQSKLYRIATRP